MSISIGGNDAGFSDTMTACVLNDDRTCLDRIATASAFIRGQLPAKLGRVYDAIGLQGTSHVVVLGYPRFYNPARHRLRRLSETKRTAINKAADLLDSVVADRARSHGFGLRRRQHHL
ncbi:hypothetical protein GCM10020221_30090 [Streptomyces thioluteus]|uniref:SGNH hydrolase-type esterase domain-containing protein n=1 Tax=Streptomyces thioluteus TaxID=66431 RepID=A0ABN3X194_STRTU